MTMKIIFLIMIVMMTITSKADIIVNTLWKYGPSSYKSNGFSYSEVHETYHTNGKLDARNEVNSIQTMNESERKLIMGVGLQYVPLESGLSIGVGYFQDETSMGSLGWKFQ